MFTFPSFSGFKNYVICLFAYEITETYSQTKICLQIVTAQQVFVKS